MVATRERARIASPYHAAPAPVGPRRQGWIRPSLVIVAVIAAAVYGLWPLVTRPTPRGVDTPAEEFSAARAMEHVVAIAQRPHPVGSAAMGDVATYLAEQLTAARVEVDRPDIGGLHNVVGRIPGIEPRGAILFVSHADSVPAGPGAGDNATGAAALVEVARALSAGQPLRNDVIVLLEDGEERGFLGGETFAESHPWMTDVRVVIGVDTAAWGPPHVSQTSNGNGLIVDAYARGVRHPLAYGFAGALDADSAYETTPFRLRSLPAMEIEDNYANVDQHTSRDTADGVDPGRVQQVGDQALDLARALGRMDLRDAEAPDRVFHTFAGIGVVHYAVSWDVVLTGLAALGLGAAVTIGVRRRVLRPGRLLASSALAIGLVLAVTLAGVGLAALYDAWRPNPNPDIAEYLLPSSAAYAIASYGLLVVLLALGYWRLGRRLGFAHIGLGFLVLLTLLTLLLLAAFPGSEYAMVWPCLFATAAWCGVLLRPDRSATALLAPALVGVALIAPLMPDGYFGTGVANIPVVAFTAAIGLGALLGPALTIGGVESERKRPAPDAVLIDA